MTRGGRKGARGGSESDGVSEGLGLRSIVREFGPIGLLLAPLAGLVYWLWRRSRKQS